MAALKEIRDRTLELIKGKEILDERVNIKARPLTTEEAIGNPEGDDFPLQKGREALMQAEFAGSYGQAFTDRYGDFEGSLEEILEMPLENNFRRAVLVATINALLRHMGLIDKTIHCRDKGPAQCGEELSSHLKERFEGKKVLQVGFQPRMVESLSGSFPLRVLDMDMENIGKQKFQVVIEGSDATEDAVSWADLLLVTGTTLVNDSIDQFLNGKDILFYGTTIAGAAYLMNWDRFCAKSL